MFASLLFYLANWRYMLTNPLTLVIAVFVIWMFAHALRNREWLWAVWNLTNWKPKIRSVAGQQNQFTILAPNGNWQGAPQPMCDPHEPRNFIYPYFSGRKTTDFNLQVNENNT
jgi:hypothetical protein